MARIQFIEKVSVQEGRRGPWSVERFALGDKSRTDGLGRGAIVAGTYTKLVHAERGIVMSDTPDEMRDHETAVACASGIGQAIESALAKT